MVQAVPSQLKPSLLGSFDQPRPPLFDGHTPQGTVTFHEGFKADGQQEGAGDAASRRSCC